MITLLVLLIIGGYLLAGVGVADWAMRRDARTSAEDGISPWLFGPLMVAAFWPFTLPTIAVAALVRRIGRALDGRLRRYERLADAAVAARREQARLVAEAEAELNREHDG